MVRIYSYEGKQSYKDRKTGGSLYILYLLNIIFICSMAFNATEAKQKQAPEPNFFPPMATLPQEELKPLLERLDKAIESGIVEEKYKVLSMISRHVVEENMRFRGSDVLRYNNPEIKERVARLYLKECSKSIDMGPGPTNPWSYGGGEYQALFMTLAESTFDPSIYEKVLNPPDYYGQLRILYLATVNPEKTLNYLFESKCGQHIGKIGNPDYFYHGEVSWGMSVDDAYTLLSLMSVQSPKVLIRNRDSVTTFIKNHHKHFSSARKVEYRPDPVYLKEQDYDVRNGALDVIKLLGTQEDIKLVEEIIRNAPVLDSKQIKGGPRGRCEQIEEKGKRLIERIRQMNSKDNI